MDLLQLGDAQAKQSNFLCATYCGEMVVMGCGKLPQARVTALIDTALNKLCSACLPAAL